MRFVAFTFGGRTRVNIRHPIVIQSLQLSFNPFTPEFKGPEAEGKKARKYFELKPGSFLGLRSIQRQCCKISLASVYQDD